MNTTELLLLPERRLQHLVRLLLSDHDALRHTTTGKPLQIVSPGEWNRSSGPDFRNMAVLVDGRIIIGDGEFHRRNSDWTGHGHQHDPAYDNLLLHIVLEDNTGRPFAAHTVVIGPDELTALLHVVPDPANETGGTLSEELQEYAYRRLLRKTTEAVGIVQHSGAVAAFVALAQQYAEKRRQSRQRPGSLSAFRAVEATTLPHSAPAQLLALVERGGAGMSMYRNVAELTAARWMAAGTATRMELLVNAFLPVALAVAQGQARNDVLAWYWSQRSVQRYGNLQRRYPAIGQEYIWKQQGLLEYVAHHKFGPDRVAESHPHNGHLLEAAHRTILPGTRIILTVEWGGKASPAE